MSGPGILSDYLFSTPNNGLGNNAGWVTTTTLPGSPVQHFRGIGTNDVTGILNPRQGTLEVFCKVGAAGTARAVAFVMPTGAPDTNNKAIGVALDTTNRPLAFLSDFAGVVVATSAPSGSAVTSGSLLTLRLAWNSQAAVNGLRFASLRVNGEMIPDAEWGSGALATWTPFVPTQVAIGISDTTLSYADFNGTLYAVQQATLITV